MANNTIWIEKFKISSDIKAEFENSLSSDKSFLVWCLENGHVDEREYLSWASEEFQLPVISSEFFVSDEVRESWKATWTSARDLHAWNQSLLPLHESAGVVRIGCLEVPELKFEQPVAYVLAPLSGMRALWRETQEETVPAIVIAQAPAAEAQAPVAEAPFAMDVPPPPPQEFDANSLMASWGSPEEESSEPPPQPELEASLEEPSQMPDGFAMPEGFNVADIPLPSMETVTAPTESAIDVPIPQVDIPMPMLAKAPSIELPPPVETVEPVVEAAQTPPPLPPPVPEFVEKAAPSETIVVKAKPPIPPMAPATLGKQNAEYLGMIDLRNAKDKLEQCQDLGEVACHAFTKFSRYFDRHMILLMKGFELRPHVWAGSWNLRSTRPASIDLDQPSIFRIVSRTKLPYHGYTKPSVLNDMFFAEWSNGAAPAHVTALPLVVNDQLIGVVLGATDGSLDLKISLMETQRWAEEISTHVARTKSLSQKAAA